MAYSADTIYFSLPDFYHNSKLNMILLNMMEKSPGWFRENIKVDSIYGSFPSCIWNGGRGQYGATDFDNIAKTIQMYNNIGISLRFTFTNSLISVRQHKDHYGNVILEAAHNGLNGVNVNSELFAKYIEENYPKYYLMWSTTKHIKDVDEINKLSESRLTVPPYTMNNTSAVNDFTHPENIELLCCEACIDNCPNRTNHYKSIAEGQMVLPTKPFTCPHGCEIYYYHDLVPTRKHHISYESMVNDYLPLGINKFKISGRNDNVINNIERYVEYLVKPEYKDLVRNHLLLDFFN